MVSHVKGCHSYWWKVMKHITNQFCIFYKHLTFSEYTRPIWQLVQFAESFLWTISAQHFQFATLVLSSNQLGPIGYRHYWKNLLGHTVTLFVRALTVIVIVVSPGRASLCPQRDLHWARIHIVHVAAPVILMGNHKINSELLVWIFTFVS